MFATLSCVRRYLLQKFEDDVITRDTRDEPFRASRGQERLMSQCVDFKRL